jgi:hypothetical protein
MQRAPTSSGFNRIHGPRSSSQGYPSGGSWRDLLLDSPPYGAIGNIEIVAGLQVDPELRGRAEVPPKTNRGVRGEGAASAHDVVCPGARHLDRMRQLVDIRAERPGRGGRCGMTSRKARQPIKCCHRNSGRPGPGTRRVIQLETDTQRQSSNVFSRWSGLPLSRGRRMRHHKSPARHYNTHDACDATGRRRWIHLRSVMRWRSK